MSIIVSPKIFKAKDLEIGENAVALYLKTPGFEFILKYHGFDQYEDYVLNYEKNQCEKYFGSKSLPEKYVIEITNIRNQLIEKTCYVDCSFRFKIHEDKIILNFGIYNDVFLPYEEIRTIAKDLNLDVIKPVWKGNYNNNVPYVFLEDTLIQRF